MVEGPASSCSRKRDDADGLVERTPSPRASRRSPRRRLIAAHAARAGRERPDDREGARVPGGRSRSPTARSTANDRFTNYETSAAVGAFANASVAKFAAAQAKARDYLVEQPDPERREPVDFGGFPYVSTERPDRARRPLEPPVRRRRPPTTPASPQGPRVLGARREVPRARRRTAARRTRSAVKRTDKDLGEEVEIVSGNDGGAGYGPGMSKAGLVERADGKFEPRSYGSMTYALLKCLLFAGVKADDPRVDAAVGWISKNFTVDRNPGFESAKDPAKAAQQGYYYYLLTMGRALAEYEKATGKALAVTDAAGKAHDWRREVAAKLVSLQKPDGSWVNPVDRWEEGDAAPRDGVRDPDPRASARDACRRRTPAPPTGPRRDRSGVRGGGRRRSPGSPRGRATARSSARDRRRGSSASDAVGLLAVTSWPRWRRSGRPTSRSPRSSLAPLGLALAHAALAGRAGARPAAPWRRSRSSASPSRSAPRGSRPSGGAVGCPAPAAGAIAAAVLWARVRGRLVGRPPRRARRRSSARSEVRQAVLRRRPAHGRGVRRASGYDRLRSPDGLRGDDDRVERRHAADRRGHGVALGGRGAGASPGSRSSGRGAAAPGRRRGPVSGPVARAAARSPTRRRSSSASAASARRARGRSPTRASVASCSSTPTSSRPRTSRGRCSSPPRTSASRKAEVAARAPRPPGLARRGRRRPLRRRDGRGPARARRRRGRRDRRRRDEGPRARGWRSRRGCRSCTPRRSAREGRVLDVPAGGRPCLACLFGSARRTTPRATPARAYGVFPGVTGAVGCARGGGRPRPPRVARAAPSRGLRVLDLAVPRGGDARGGDRPACPVCGPGPRDASRAGRRAPSPRHRPPAACAPARGARPARGELPDEPPARAARDGPRWRPTRRSRSGSARKGPPRCPRGCAASATRSCRARPSAQALRLRVRRRAGAAPGAAGRGLRRLAPTLRAADRPAGGGRGGAASPRGRRACGSRGGGTSLAAAAVHLAAAGVGTLELESGLGAADGRRGRPVAVRARARRGARVRGLGARARAAHGGDRPCGRGTRGRRTDAPGRRLRRRAGARAGVRRRRGAARTGAGRARGRRDDAGDPHRAGPDARGPRPPRRDGRAVVAASGAGAPARPRVSAASPCGRPRGSTRSRARR